MSKLSLYHDTPQATQKLGSLLAQHGPSRLILLNGDLGAGKTTFSQGFAKGLGITEPVTSPTFSLINQYNLPDGGTFYHLDIYRLYDYNELFDLGFEEMLADSNAYILIEWANKFEEIEWPLHTTIQLSHSPPGREIELQFPASDTPPHFTAKLKETQCRRNA